MTTYSSDFKRWVNRYLHFEDLSDKEMQRLYKEYQKTNDDILAFLSLLWVRMGDRVDYANAMFNGLDNTRIKIHSSVDDLFQKTVTPNITVYLKSIYKEGFTDALNRLPLPLQQKGIPFLNDDYVTGQINLRWAGDGKLFSDRIWEHKEHLKSAMDRTLHDSITAGRDIRQVSREFAEEMGTSYHNAERLVRTETNYVVNQSELDVLRQTGVEKYEYVAYLDNRTSQICREHDGKVYLTSQAQVGVNYPPLHPNCRSTVAPYIDLKE